MPAELLRLSNFDTVNVTALTTLQSAAAASQDDLALAGASEFGVGAYVVIEPMSENAEIAKIESISGTTLTLTANLTRSHVANSRVWQLFGKHIKVYRAENVDGTEPDQLSFEALPGTEPANPIVISPDQTYTEVTDPSGGVSYWYKAVFYNSDTESDTDLSWAMAVRGGDYGHYATLEDIRDEAGLAENTYVTDQQVDRARVMAESEVNGAVAVANYTMPITVDVPLLTTITQLLAAGHLLSRSYGIGAEGTSKDGAALKKQARDMLTQIMDRSLILYDSVGVQVPNTIGEVEDTTIVSEAREPIFRMGDVF